MSTSSFSLEGLLVYLAEMCTAGVIESYEGRRLLEDSPLIQCQCTLEGFGREDTVFQEYDPPDGDNSKMGWKHSRPAKWWISLLKAMKYVFYIQVLGGLALGSIAISLLVLDLNSVDLCFDKQSGNWKTLPHKIQAIVVTSAAAEAYVVQLWPFLLVLVMFGWALVKKLNLLTLNLLGAFLDTYYRLSLHSYGIYDKPWRSYPLNVLFLIIVLVNSIAVGRDLAKTSENGRSKKIKTIQLMAVLSAQFAFGIPIALVLVYKIIPLYHKQNETFRAVIAGALPLMTAVPKVIVRLAAQRMDFLHPGDSHVLVSVLYSASAIVFRVMQAELTSLRLFILLSLAHGCVDLLERLTIVLRDCLWYFLYKKVLKRDGVDRMTRTDKFRTPRSMRLIADMSIQMMLGEATSLIAAVGFIQLYSFMYNRVEPFSSDVTLVGGFFVRVSIALTIDFIFNSLSCWLQMWSFNVSVARVWRIKWRKHLLVGLIFTTLTLCFFTTHLFAVVREKHNSATKHTLSTFNCTGPFSRF